ncbi:trypsin, alkaline B-like isoform X1 [Plutella xylostella]|uniref:trypsin, alkaline B-like isoform X1 n=1 Tax=Plutella xylostella TaxID=51655 RepID=UPI00203267FC|nr:trypsin, alkaline B-like isoform X1 [Plutella xylostella]
MSILSTNKFKNYGLRVGRYIITFSGSCEDMVTVREPSAPPANRIVGGRPTTVEAYPYMAYLRSLCTMRGQRLLGGYCGGVILTQHHVLTAAHCLFRIINDTTILRASKVVIRVGSTYNDRGGSKHETSKTLVHEDYKYSESKDNDVAVLVLPTSVSNYRSSSVQPAAIPPGGYVVPDNASVVAVGWGRTDMKCIMSSPIGLRLVGLRKVDRDTCAARYPRFSYNNMLCAGLLGVGGAGTCKGDSGGPLVYNGVVVGVTSFAMRCADSFYPHVFTRVSSYTNWINNTLRQNQVVVVHKLSHNTAVADVSSLMLLAFVTSIWIMYSEIIYF